MLVRSEAPIRNAIHDDTGEINSIPNDILAMTSEVICGDTILFVICPSLQHAKRSPLSLCSDSDVGLYVCRRRTLVQVCDCTGAMNSVAVRPVSVAIYHHRLFHGVHSRFEK